MHGTWCVIMALLYLFFFLAIMSFIDDGAAQWHLKVRTNLDSNLKNLDMESRAMVCNVPSRSQGCLKGHIRCSLLLILREQHQNNTASGEGTVWLFR